MKRSAVADRMRARRARRVAEREALRDRESEERITARLAAQVTQQWSEGRAARQTTQPVIDAGPSNFSKAKVPYGLDLAAAWSWRFIVISIAVLAILWTLRFFAVLVLPLIIALLIAALSAPLVAAMQRAKMPRKAASGLVVLGGLGVVALLLTFVGQQIIEDIDDLSRQVVSGLDEIQDWLKTGPLGVSDSQINDSSTTPRTRSPIRPRNWAATRLRSAPPSGTSSRDSSSSCSTPSSSSPTAP